MKEYDKIIIGAGMYGLYAASVLSRRRYKVLVIDCEEEAFSRGSYVNQARLHNGYHYPRSYATASKSSHYFERFLNEFGECVNTEFEKIYAIAKEYSWTNAEQFSKFCKNLNLQCNEIEKEKYFNETAIEKAYLTREYTFDSKLLYNHLKSDIDYKYCDFLMGIRIETISEHRGKFCFTFEDDTQVEGSFVLNATYAGTNQIQKKCGFEILPIKYELCEVILCNVSENIKAVGLTVMDGPFLSVMPFGKTGYHSITTVSRTPHMTSYDPLPQFPCQTYNSSCIPEQTMNCNNCSFRPESSSKEMLQIANKYFNKDIKIKPVKSLFTLKPILKASEIDDSRPTIIRKYSNNPDFYTVFSGKINTMYDLDEILEG